MMQVCEGCAGGVTGHLSLLVLDLFIDGAGVARFAQSCAWYSKKQNCNGGDNDIERYLIKSLLNILT